MYESTAPVLDTLLRLVYPVDSPALDDFEIISGVAAAAKKYEMTLVTKRIAEALRMNSFSYDMVKVMQAYFVASFSVSRK